MAYELQLGIHGTIYTIHTYDNIHNAIDIVPIFRQFLWLESCLPWLRVPIVLTAPERVSHLLTCDRQQLQTHSVAPVPYIPRHGNGPSLHSYTMYT